MRNTLLSAALGCMLLAAFSAAPATAQAPEAMRVTGPAGQYRVRRAG